MPPPSWLPLTLPRGYPMSDLAARIAEILTAHGGAVQGFYDLDPDQYPVVVLYTPGGER